MKKFYLGLVSLMLIMLHSCSQDELESTPINEPQAIKVVNIIDGNISTANTRTDDANYATMALQFSSEAEVQELLDDFATYDKNKAYKCQINMSYNNQ